MSSSGMRDNGTNPRIPLVDVTERVATPRRPPRESGRWHVSKKTAMWGVGILVGLIMAAGGVVYGTGQLTERKADRAELANELDRLEGAAARDRAELRKHHDADVKEIREDLSDLRGDIREMRVEQRMILREIAPRAAAGLEPLDGER